MYQDSTYVGGSHGHGAGVKVDPNVQVRRSPVKFKNPIITFNFTERFLHVFHYVVVLACKIKGSLSGKELVKSGHLCIDFKFHTLYTMGNDGFHDKMIHTHCRASGENKVLELQPLLLTRVDRWAN